MTRRCPGSGWAVSARRLSGAVTPGSFRKTACAAMVRCGGGGLPARWRNAAVLYLGRSLEGEDGACRAHCPARGGRSLFAFSLRAAYARADSLLLRAGETVPVHEFHYWDSTENGARRSTRKARDGAALDGFAGRRCMQLSRTCIFAGRPQLAERFRRPPPFKAAGEGPQFFERPRDRGHVRLEKRPGNK